MKRRSFLGLLGGAVAATAVKAEPSAEATFTTPEMNVSSDRKLVRMAVIDADGRRGYLISEGDRFTIEGNPRTFTVLGRA